MPFSFQLMFVYFLFDNLVYLLLLFPRRQEGNADPVIGRAIKLNLIYFLHSLSFFLLISVIVL